MLCVLFNSVAMTKIAFFVTSPASNEGTVGCGGLLRSVMMSVAACLRKSVMVTSGKLICLGRKVTVSASTSDLVLGRKHLTQR